MCGATGRVGVGVRGEAIDVVELLVSLPLSEDGGAGNDDGSRVYKHTTT